MDTTAIGIVIGLACAVTHMVGNAVRKGSFEHTTFAVFLGGYAVVPSCHLVFAAFMGDVTQLPSKWREYLSAAGIVSFGIAVNGASKMIREAWRHPKSLQTATPASTEEEGKPSQR